MSGMQKSTILMKDIRMTWYYFTGIWRIGI